MVDREPGKVFTDEIVEGNWIVPPGRKQPIEVIAQFTDPDTNTQVFEFACLTKRRGRVALRLQRTDQVAIVPASEV
ncbi:hypothetical protein [Aeromicrobium sp. 179-A 4D2 NHS]|uniref:hypothetical protein n=1 Tax=Aeromicrobium sp. 179-A 4D2 NHS TaxID=3142375 RepID=UPI00399F85AF